MKLYKLLFSLNFTFLFFFTSLSAQEKNIEQEHIVQSINILLKQDIEHWETINVRPFKAKTKIDSIKNQTFIAMDFIRGYEAFKDYKNLKLISIDKVQTFSEHVNEGESALEYITAFTMQDSVSGKKYGFIAEDIFWSNNKFKGFKLVRANSLSSISIDKLWQDYIDGFSVKAEIPAKVVIVEYFIYEGILKEEKFNLKWKTEVTQDKKSYTILLNQNQKTPIKLQLHTTNHQNYLLITEPYSGHFTLTKYANVLKGVYHDADGKKYKIKWTKKE